MLPPHLSFRYSTVFILTHEFSHFYSYFLPNPTAVECEEAGKRLYGCLARMKTTVYPADLFSEPKAVIATCLAPESLYLAIFKQILLEWDFHTWIFYAKFDLKKGLSKHWQKKSHLLVTLDILQLSKEILRGLKGKKFKLYKVTAYFRLHLVVLNQMAPQKSIHLSCSSYLIPCYLSYYASTSFCVAVQ